MKGQVTASAPKGGASVGSAGRHVTASGWKTVDPMAREAGARPAVATERQNYRTTS